MNIDLSNEIDALDKHLDTYKNIILSAKFGDGKSTLLKKFEKAKKDKYVVITLHPVNYVVQDNADIFELIKRDIILQMHEKGIELMLDNEFQDLVGNALISKDTLDDFFSFIGSVPGLGIFDKAEKLIEGIYKRYNSAKKELETYISSFALTKGSIYEKDLFTIAISNTLKHQKDDSCVNKNKKILLVIEDMDRLDPAHLFRILNIFAAQFELDENNKFGFDNIVLVMDYDTTGSIFHHFYGNKANYKGYMDKFSSNHPFKFSIREIASLQLKEKIKKDYYEFPDSIWELKFIGKNENELQSINDIIATISVRKIDKMISYDPFASDIRDEDILPPTKHGIYPNHQMLLLLLAYTAVLTGESVKNLFENLMKYMTDPTTYTYFYLPFYCADTDNVESIFLFDNYIGHKCSYALGIVEIGNPFDIDHHMYSNKYIGNIKKNVLNHKHKILQMFSGLV